MIREVPGRKPRIHPGAYVDIAAQVIGDVTIEEGASVWPFSVLRGDQDNYVRLGRNSNVQDNSVLHVTPQFLGWDAITRADHDRQLINPLEEELSVRARAGRCACHCDVDWRRMGIKRWQRAIGMSRTARPQCQPTAALDIY